MSFPTQIGAENSAPQLNGAWSNNPKFVQKLTAAGTVSVAVPTGMVLQFKSAKALLVGGVGGAGDTLDIKSGANSALAAVMDLSSATAVGKSVNSGDLSTTAAYSLFTGGVDTVDIELTDGDAGILELWVEVEFHRIS